MAVASDPGFAGSFRVEGAQGLDYQRFSFPGVVTMVVLFSAIFATISVIEDRREGFLQSVLAGPGSRLDVERLLVPLTDRSGEVAAVMAAVPFLRPSDRWFSWPRRWPASW